MELVKSKKHRFNVGKWLPDDFKIISNHIKGIKSFVVDNPKELTSNIKALNDYVISDPQLFQWSNDMFTEVPKKYEHSEYGNELKSWAEFIPLLNGIMTMTQTFNETGCVGFPINALLDWAMGTKSGHMFFKDNGVNEHFYKVLNDWSEFLMSPASKYAVYNSNELVDKYPGHFADDQYYWLSDKAMVSLANALNNGEKYDGDPEAARDAFINAFHCPDTNDPHYGFKSWDDFFIRKFNSGMRPVAEGDNIIANACESGPYRVAYNVKRRDAFWLKGQPYSLINIFNEKEEYTPLTDKYEGGTIYQAFLSAESYHRWHSPVDGVIKKVYNTVNQFPFNSTYYSELLPENPFAEDNAGPNQSQGYISNVAARGIIEIKSNNPAIGDMCIIPIGMAECSTCEITVASGKHVKKGDQLGMFHFGGSTHLLVFQKDVNLLFDFHDQKPGLSANNIPINSKIATVVEDKIEYPTDPGTSGLRIGNPSTVNKNSGAVLAVVPSESSAHPIRVGNYRGEYLWGIDAGGNIDTVKGKQQAKNSEASCNLHINFPEPGKSGYIIGENPNNKICAALKIVVPSNNCVNWPLVIADNKGDTIWALDCNGNQKTANPLPFTETAILNMPYPANEEATNAFTIGDVAKTTECYGGISIIVPKGEDSSGVYAIAVVDSKGDFLWGVDGSGEEVTMYKN